MIKYIDQRVLENLLDSIYKMYPEGMSSMPSDLEEVVLNALIAIDRNEEKQKETVITKSY